MNYFFNTTFRYVNQKNIFFAVLIFLFSIILNVLTNGSNNSNIFLFLNSINGFSILSLAIIFIVILPSSLSLYEDFDKKNIRNILIRMNLKKYFFTKTLSVGITSAILTTILLTALLIVSLLYKEMPNNLANNFTLGAFKSIYPEHKILYSVIFIMNSFCFSFVFSVVAMVSTIFWNNKYSAVLITSVIYVFSDPLLYTIKLNNLGFVNLFSYSNNVFTTPAQIYIEFIIIFIVSVSAGYFKLKRSIYVNK